MAPFLDADGGSLTSSDGFLEDKSMPIAILGMALRGPGDATTAENLWKMISEARESRTTIPKERWNNDAFCHPDYKRNGTVTSPEELLTAFCFY